MKKYLGLLKKGFPRTDGEISGLSVSGRVEVLRDAWGIPHIYAANERDLFFAQGFVHAQDRLWQMEILRRFVSGRLSEITGTRTANLDFISAMLGLPRMRKAAFEELSDRERAVLNAYCDGVNAHVERQGRDLPLEFRLLHFTPEPWQPEDCMSFLSQISWQMIFPHYSAELLALVKGRDLTLAKWNDMFPCYPGASLPPDDFFEKLAGLNFGALHPAALVFHGGLPEKYSPKVLEERLLSSARAGTGSNNWAVAGSADGSPLLANDPHLGAGLPSVWYFCHLSSAEGIHAAGASVAGSPGILIGHNAHVAWGLTNAMFDALDLVVLRVDPREPTRYRSRGQEREMAQEEVIVGLPKGGRLALPLYRTVHGPVLTAVEKGRDAVAALKWYGTIPEGMLKDRTFSGLMEILAAGSVEEALEAGRSWAWVNQNIVAADDRGHIGWHPTGAAPLRHGYSGRLPVDGSEGADWVGFLPYDELPHLMDPPEGWIATANHRIASDGDPHPLSFIWGTPHRYARIASLLRETKAPTVEDFMRLQTDVHSLQADRILPKLLGFPFGRPKAREAARILASWDHEVRADSAAAAVYEVFLTEWDRILLEGDLGDEIAMYYLVKGGYSLDDVLLDRPFSPLWSGSDPAEVESGRAQPSVSGRDRQGIPPIGGRGEAESRAIMQEKLEKALVRSMEFLERSLGGRRAGWSWGRLHRHVFPHPLAVRPMLERLMNPTPIPASGDCGTVNVSWHMAAKGNYDVTAIPSMRMIVPLGDLDATRIIGPLGQSGQPGHPHFDDMNPLWAGGAYLALPFGRDAVEKVVKDRLYFEP